VPRVRGRYGPTLIGGGAGSSWARLFGSIPPEPDCGCPPDGG